MAPSEQSGNPELPQELVDGALELAGATNRPCAGCGDRVDVGLRTENGELWHWVCWKTVRGRDGVSG